MGVFAGRRDRGGLAGNVPRLSQAYRSGVPTGGQAVCVGAGPTTVGNVSVSDEAHELAERVERAASLLVLTGAGLSTAAGILDFRGPDGIWTRDPAAERASDIDVYLGEPAVRSAYWRGLLARGRAEPTAGHWAITRRVEGGRVRVVTQNTDGLHRATGLDDELVEIHGSERTTRCRRCGRVVETERVLARVRNGEADPRCQRWGDEGSCGGVLTPEVVRFGEALDRRRWRTAMAWAHTADLVVAVGTSLSVAPASTLVEVTRGAVAIVNGEPTPFDPYAALVVRDDIQTALALWNETTTRPVRGPGARAI